MIGIRSLRLPFELACTDCPTFVIVTGGHISPSLQDQRRQPGRGEPVGEMHDPVHKSQTNRGIRSRIAAIHRPTDGALASKRHYLSNYDRAGAVPRKVPFGL